MKKYFFYGFLAILLPVLLSGCFLNKSESSNEAVTVNPSKTVTFNFVVDKGVTDAEKDIFTEVIKKRATSFVAGNIKAEITENKNLKIEVTPDANIIFDETGFKNYIVTTAIFEVARKEDPEKLTLTEEEKAKLTEYNQNAKVRAEQLLANVLAAPASFAEVASQNSEDPGSRTNGGAYKGVKKGMFVPEYEEVIYNKINVGEIYAELVETGYGFHIIKKDGETGEGDGRVIDTSHILIQKVTEDQALKAKEFLATGINGLYIESIKSVADEAQKFAVEITLIEKGKALLKTFRESYPEAQLAGFINGVNAGVVVEKDGKLILKGNFTEEDAKAMVTGLSNGVFHSTVRVAE